MVKQNEVLLKLIKKSPLKRNNLSMVSYQTYLKVQFIL